MNILASAFEAMYWVFAGAGFVLMVAHSIQVLGGTGTRGSS